MRQSNCVWNPCKFLDHVYRDNSGQLVWWRHQPSGKTPPAHGTIMMVVSIIYWRLDHNDFVLNFDKDSSIVVEVKLSVDVVSFPSLVCHTAFEMALDYYEAR